MIPIDWLNNCEVTYVNVEIVQNFYNAYPMPKPFLAEKYFDSWDPKIQGPSNYIQSFYVTTLIDKCGTYKNYPLTMF